MRKLLISGLPVLLLATGCGPSVWDYVGRYPVSSTETLSNCSRGGEVPTYLAELTTLSIDQGSDSDLIINAGECLFEATMTEETLFEVPSQECTIAGDPEIRLQISGTGEVVEERVRLLLTGAYHTTDFNYNIDCDYALEVRSQ